MRRHRFVRSCAPASAFLAVALLACPLAVAATRTVDLDGNGTAESSCILNVVTSSPAKIENIVTNNSVGNAFSFVWKSAGPGFFTSSVVAPTTTSPSKSTKWTWQTLSVIYSYTGSGACPGSNDICFTKTAGPAAVTTRGPFSVPGRSLSSTSPTVSNASLTSSLITTFSPLMVHATVTSSVAPLPSGQIAYTTQYSNTTSQPLTMAIAPYPPGCCPEPHRLNCDGTCVTYLSDPSNCGGCGIVCEYGTHCSEGACGSICPAGKTLCDGICVDLRWDSRNCGACGHVCEEGTRCSGGVCASCPEGKTLCGILCVDLQTDSRNCGACGHVCEDPLCTGGQCVDGLAPDTQKDPAAVPSVIEAPVCQSPGATETIPPGGTVSNCQTRPVLAREIHTTVDLSGSGLPDGLSAQGTFNQLIPDPTRQLCDLDNPLPGCLSTFVTPFKIELQDASRDGLLQPGETGNLLVHVLNAGPVPVYGPAGTLSGIPDTLDLDNPVLWSAVVAPATATSIYSPDIHGPTAGTDCLNLPAPNPSVNVVPFGVTIPAGGPGDVGYPFSLRVTGLTDGASFQQDVPFVVGVGHACQMGAREYDVVDGFSAPLAALVPEGNPVVFPSKGFKSSTKTIPAKIRLGCGTATLTGADIDPPEIVGLSKNGVPLDIHTLNLNADNPNTDDPFFRYNRTSQRWIYNIRTAALPRPGTYILTVRLGNRANHLGGWVLLAP